MDMAKQSNQVRDQRTFRIEARTCTCTRSSQRMNFLALAKCENRVHFAQSKQMTDKRKQRPLPGLPDNMWLQIIDMLTDSQVIPLSLAETGKRILSLTCDHRVNRKLTLRNLDLRGETGILSFKRLFNFLHRRRPIEDLEIISPLHFTAEDCLRLLSTCTFRAVSFQTKQVRTRPEDANVMGVNHAADGIGVKNGAMATCNKRDAHVVCAQLREIMNTRKQLRGKAITLAREAIDCLQPDMSVGFVLDLESSTGTTTAELNSHSTTVNARSMFESMGARVIEAKKLLTRHKQQLKALGLTAPLFLQAFRCCADLRDASDKSSGCVQRNCCDANNHASSRSAGGVTHTKCASQLCDEDVRALNIPHTPGIAAKHDHLEDLLTFVTLRLRYVETLGRTLTSVLGQRELLDSVALTGQPASGHSVNPALIKPWVDRWAAIIKQLEILDRRLTKATRVIKRKKMKKRIPGTHGIQDVYRIRRRIGLFVQRDLTSDISPPKDWPIFTRAVDIAKNVFSSLKKAQRLCKLKPEAFQSLSNPSEHATAAPAQHDGRAPTIGMLLRSRLISDPNDGTACSPALAAAKYGDGLK